MRRHCFAAALLLAACGDNAPPTASVPAKPAYPFDFFPTAPLGTLGEPVTYFVDGKKVHDSTIPRTQSPGVRITADTESPKVTLRVHLPCGWRDIPVWKANITKPVLYQPPNSKPYFGPGHITLEPRVPADVFVVDNRGGAATVFRFGELQRAIEADRHAVVTVLAPCEEGAPLALGDLAIGTIAPRPADMEWHTVRTFLIDPKATRCYEYDTITYSNISVPRPRKPPTVFKRERLHRLPGLPSDLFKEAPLSVQAIRGGIAFRSQLLDIRC